MPYQLSRNECVDNVLSLNAVGGGDHRPCTYTTE